MDFVFHCVEFCVNSLTTFSVISVFFHLVSNLSKLPAIYWRRLLLWIIWRSDDTWRWMAMWSTHVLLLLVLLVLYSNLMVRIVVRTRHTVRCTLVVLWRSSMLIIILRWHSLMMLWWTIRLMLLISAIILVMMLLLLLLIWWWTIVSINSIAWSRSVLLIVLLLWYQTRRWLHRCWSTLVMLLLIILIVSIHSIGRWRLLFLRFRIIVSINHRDQKKY